MSDDEWKTATKKPVEVEFRGPYVDPTVVETLEGDFEVDGEYIDEHGGFVIIRGVEGEVYPCGLDIFNETYEFGSLGTFECSVDGCEHTDDREGAMTAHSLICHQDRDAWRGEDGQG